MSTAKAALMESMNKRHLRAVPSRVRTSQTSQRLKKIREMASTLFEEAANLEHEGGLAEASAIMKTLDKDGEIDFFEEVKRFEIRLIERALNLSGGNQAKAAKLLKLGTTTLNYKIKSYEML
jgi:transcriptional regulator with PAS, ATPase and Fis domain